MARGKTGPDEEKMLVAFEAFDSLIPNLGVYTRIFKKLRDDLYGKYCLCKAPLNAKCNCEAGCQLILTFFLTKWACMPPKGGMSIWLFVSTTTSLI